jgi:hypothetical protein
MVMKDARVLIGSDIGIVDNLEGVLDLYRAGCRIPSNFFAEAAFAYCQQLIANRSRGRTDPLTKAIKTIDYQIDNGYAEELSILFPEHRGPDLLNNQFVAICHDFMLPIMEQVEIDTNV